MDTWGDEKEQKNYYYSWAIKFKYRKMLRWNGHVENNYRFYNYISWIE